MKRLIEHIVKSYKSNILLETRGVGIQIWEKGIRALHDIIQKKIFDLNRNDIENNKRLNREIEFVLEYEDIIDLVNEWYNTRRINYFPGLQRFMVNVYCIKRYLNTDKNNLNYGGGVVNMLGCKNFELNIRLDCNYKGEINDEKFFTVLFHEFKHIYDGLLSKQNGQSDEEFNKRFTYLDIDNMWISEKIHYLLHFISPGEMSARLTEFYYEITPELIEKNYNRIKNINDLIKCTSIYQKFIRVFYTYEKTINRMWPFQAKILLKHLTKPSQKYPNGRGVYNRDFKDYKELKNFLKQRSYEILMKYYNSMYRIAGDKIQELGDKYNWIR
jgi:hypothetical protein